MMLDGDNPGLTAACWTGVELAYEERRQALSG